MVARSLPRGQTRCAQAIQQVRPITAIGVVDNVTEERSWVLDDWLTSVLVGDHEDR